MSNLKLYTSQTNVFDGRQKLLKKHQKCLPLYSFCNEFLISSKYVGVWRLALGFLYFNAHN